MTNILFIDRAEAAQSTTQTALGQQYHLIMANSGSMALHHCAMIQPDLVLMATDLPDIKGDELALRLKMFMPNVPILFMADGHHPPPPDLVVETNRLVKPLQMDVLQQKIQSLVTTRSSSPLCDDGRGFVEQRLNCDRFDQNEQQRRGLGLVSMRRRAERLGGALRMNSVEGQGTCILVTLPLQAET